MLRHFLEGLLVLTDLVGVKIPRTRRKKPALVMQWCQHRSWYLASGAGFCSDNSSWCPADQNLSNFESSESRPWPTIGTAVTPCPPRFHPCFHHAAIRIYFKLWILDYFFLCLEMGTRRRAGVLIIGGKLSFSRSLAILLSSAGVRARGGVEPSHNLWRRFLRHFIRLSSVLCILSDLRNRRRGVKERGG